MNKDFPYPYFFYGSHDSQDLDVFVQIPRDVMPSIQEDRKRFIKKLEVDYELPWNANLIVVEDGIVVDTIYPKSWIDSVNNSFYTTYHLHLDKQVFPLPINRLVKRNKLLAIYKTVRVILSMLSRTDYRPVVKPYLNGVHSFDLKVNALKNIKLQTLTTFNQQNTSDVDIWKMIAFYIGQNISLVRDDIEIYTKTDLCINHPDLKPFVYREQITDDLKKLLDDKITFYINDILIPYGDFICDKNIMKSNGEIIDMKKEIW